MGSRRGYPRGASAARLAADLAVSKAWSEDGAMSDPALVEPFVRGAVDADDVVVAVRYNRLAADPSAVHVGVAE